MQDPPNEDEAFHKLMANADYDFNMDYNTDIVSVKGTSTVRQKIGHILNSKGTLFVVSVLIILDCLMVVMYLLFELEVIFVGPGFRFVHTALHCISLAILSVFVFEIFLRIYVYRAEFFRHAFEVVDALVIFISFGLDLAFAFHGNAALAAEIHLVIVLRFWRITRILSSIVESVQNSANRRIERQRRVTARYCKETEKYKDHCDQQAAEIKRLETILEENNVYFFRNNLTLPT